MLLTSLSTTTATTKFATIIQGNNPAPNTALPLFSLTVAGGTFRY